MKIQKSAEDYLEAILVVERRRGAARGIDIANELGFSKPSVSIAMKNLRGAGYIDTASDGSLVLTDKGREIAERIYERHTLLTEWLVSLGVSRDQALEDACKMEHVISTETFDAMKRHAKTKQE